MKKPKLFGALLLIIISGHSFAQKVDLDKLLDERTGKESKEKTKHTQATFKATGLVNGQTVETTQAGVLDLKISHRFGTLNGGAYNFFGLDEASIRIGLNYGLTKRLCIGIGRSSFEKQFDAFAKYRLLWQTEGKKNVPVSVTLLSSMMLKTIKDPVDTIKRNLSDKFSFAFQALIARKFNDAFSLQLMPTLVHYNVVPTSDIKNDFYSLGVGARIALSKRTSLIAEYYYVFPSNKFPETYNSFSVGYEIETGGHIFQLNFTNSTGLTEKTFITETTGQWSKGDIHFGFNISRVFTVHRVKEQKW